jgi:phosphodiesterase/alkaline phosphatase D-like protein
VFVAREILGRPTDHSVTVRALGAQALEVYAEWGAASGTYTGRTAAVSFPARTPIELVMDGLAADTPYFYRIRYRTAGAAAFSAGDERRFRTARRSGQAFTFDVQADPHLDENSSTTVYAQTLANMVADQPDFLVDLGDVSMADKCVVQGSELCAKPSPPSYEGILARNLLQRSYFERAAHSIPLLMVLGNHEGEAGWLEDGTANNISVWDTQARKTLYANPRPDGFYTGSSVESPYVGLREDYYAFQWGDALIVVLNPFSYTKRKPTAATDDDMWQWTLGETQYRWLRQTLETSTARFKMVFSHHQVGSSVPEVRGGVASAQFFEWGGRNLNGSYGFDSRRPGWGKPIHQLMVDTGVNIWFHGHDHVYVAEELDGIVYQEVPQPSLARYDSVNSAADYGYVGTVGVNVFASSGHLRVSVSPDQLRVEYVRSVPPADETATRKNGAVVTAYTVRRR